MTLALLPKPESLPVSCLERQGEAAAEELGVPGASSCFNHQCSHLGHGQGLSLLGNFPRL